MGVNIQPVRSLSPAQSRAPSCVQERSSLFYDIDSANNDRGVQALIYVNPWGVNISPEGATITPRAHCRRTHGRLGWRDRQGGPVHWPCGARPLRELQL